MADVFIQNIDSYPQLIDEKPLLSVIDNPAPQAMFISDNDYPYMLSAYNNELSVISEPAPHGMFITTADINNGYPYFISNTNKQTVVSSPEPEGIYVIDTDKSVNNGYPYFITHLNPLSVINLPEPVGIFISDDSVNEGYPVMRMLNPLHMGGFNEAENLISVKLPDSLLNLGKYSFSDTALTDVVINADCIIPDTAFPKDCTITISDNK